MNARMIACSGLAAALIASNSLAQQAPTQTTPPPTATAQPGMQAQELYHVHFVKAAPGKLTDLIAGYQASPVPQNEPGPPLILRHMQGDDWDLLVLTPLGKEETLTTTAPTQEEQRSMERLRGLRTWHGDTFTAGPSWADVRTALFGDATRATGTAGGPSGAVYTVTTYRSLPGHRDQLAATLQKVAALYPDRRTILQHIEGAPWEFVMISRYDSWGALGEDQAPPAEKLRSQGFASNEAIGLALREHTAEHRDTIAQMVTAPSTPVR